MPFLEWRISCIAPPSHYSYTHHLPNIYLIESNIVTSTRGSVHCIVRGPGSILGVSANRWSLWWQSSKTDSTVTCKDTSVMNMFVKPVRCMGDTERNVVSGDDDDGGGHHVWAQTWGWADWTLNYITFHHLRPAGPFATLKLILNTWTL